MNSSRSISHLFVVAGLALASNAYAMETVTNLKAKAVNFVGNNKMTFAANALNSAAPEDADAAKAAIDTLGFAGDSSEKVNPEELIENFVLNYTIRKAVRCAAKNGYSLDALADTMNILPAKVGTHVNPMVKGTVKAVAPQFIAGNVVKILNSKKSRE